MKLLCVQALDFNSHLYAGGDLSAMWTPPPSSISTHTSALEVTYLRKQIASQRTISTHTSTREVTNLRSVTTMTHDDFNSHLHAGGDFKCRFYTDFLQNFNSHLHAGGDLYPCNFADYQRHFNSHLHAGGDGLISSTSRLISLFQLTPPRGR